MSVSALCISSASNLDPSSSTAKKTPPTSNFMTTTVNVTSGNTTTFSLRPTSPNLTDTTVSTPSSSTSSALSTENSILLCDSGLNTALTNCTVKSSQDVKTIFNIPANDCGLTLNRRHPAITPISTTVSTTIDGTAVETSTSQSQHALETSQSLLQTPLNEDVRTLQLALELSLVGLNDDQCNYFDHQDKIQQQFGFPQHQQNTQLQKTEIDLGTLNAISAVIAANQQGNLNTPNTYSNAAPAVNGLLMPSTVFEDRSKKSQNMTECVPVPSSEHVAEIVGRQGCKIKALRAKTNTYIKTPVRGEEPVFVVTGRKEDVNKAKREILSAADHFSLIRATRKPLSVEGNSQTNNGLNGVSFGARTASGPPSLPGQITIQVRVPYRVVGLVVGPKGATIKHIQQETQTYIVTPSREKEPIFEVTGLPENVQTARKQIEAHIALRTGNSQNAAAISSISPIVDTNQITAVVPTINTLTQILNEDINPEFLASLYKNEICTGIDYSSDALIEPNAEIVSDITSPCVSFNATTNVANTFSNTQNNRFQVDNAAQVVKSMNGGECTNAAKITSQIYYDNAIFHHNDSNDPKTLVSTTTVTNNMSGNSVATGSKINAVSGVTRSCSSASSTTSTKSTNNSAGSSNSPPELINLWKNISDSIDVDEGIGESPNIWNLPTSTLNVLNGSHCSPTISISPTDSLLGEVSLNTNQLQHSVGSNNCNNINNMLIRHQQQLQTALPQISSIGGKSTSLRRECFVCSEKEVTSALVPCGHNMFCMDCANQICLSIDAICPICSSIVYHAMRILA